MRPADLPRPDEIALALYVLARTEEHIASGKAGYGGAPHAANYIQFHPEGKAMPYKRLSAILLKWDKRGDWSYGVSDWMGWIEPKGLAWFRDLRETVAKIDPAKVEALSAACPIPRQPWEDSPLRSDAVYELFKKALGVGE